MTAAATKAEWLRSSSVGEAAGAILGRLAAGRPVAEPVVLVAAHPDDETLALGSRLRLFRRLTLVHVTDGAPFDMSDAHRAGFRSREAYAAAREGELAAALVAAEARPVRRLRYGYPDQTVVDRLPELIDRLACDLDGAAAVLTHAYEGGHPDHDACALAVQQACARLAHGPTRLEFAGYFSEGGRAVHGRFRSDSDARETAFALSGEDRARRAAALACFASQAPVLADFPPDREACRPAPSYDFSAPPPSGEALYDRFGWSLTSAAWRARAAALA